MQWEKRLVCGVQVCGRIVGQVGGPGGGGRAVTTGVIDVHGEGSGSPPKNLMRNRVGPPPRGDPDAQTSSKKFKRRILGGRGKQHTGHCVGWGCNYKFIDPQ